MTSFSLPPEKLYVYHGANASATNDLIARIEIGAVESGALIEVTTIGLIQGHGVTSARSVVALVRDAAGNYADFVALIARGGIELTHSIVPDGSTVYLQAEFAATGSGNNLHHFVSLTGPVAKMQGL